MREAGSGPAAGGNPTCSEGAGRGPWGSPGVAAGRQRSPTSSRGPAGLGALPVLRHGREGGAPPGDAFPSLATPLPILQLVGETHSRGHRCSVTGTRQPVAGQPGKAPGSAHKEGQVPQLETAAVRESRVEWGRRAWKRPVTPQRARVHVEAGPKPCRTRRRDGSPTRDVRAVAAEEAKAEGGPKAAWAPTRWRRLRREPPERSRISATCRPSRAWPRSLPLDARLGHGECGQKWHPALPGAALAPARGLPCALLSRTGQGPEKQGPRPALQRGMA